MRKESKARFSTTAFGLALLILGSPSIRLRADEAVRLSRPSARLFTQTASKAEENRQLLLKKKEAFRRSSDLLTAHGVPFDPNELLDTNWRKNLAPRLALMSELQTDRRVKSKRLKGVYIADTLRLPEKMEADGDVVILARTLVYGGENVEIIAPGKEVSIFVIESQKHSGLSRTSVESSDARFRTTSVYIRTGVYERFDGRVAYKIINGVATQVVLNEDGMNGAPGFQGITGIAGDTGANGVDGEDGICTGTRSGTRGGEGEEGDAGEQGGDGQPGFDGGDAGDINLEIRTPTLISSRP
ncbi:MAG TPA: hypothetical protein VJQ56_05400, partial [Blastocatellia bacterium]|nr:hypothetical protein [Blastocatellia bacterium]